MSPVGDDGGEEDLSHVRSGGHSVTHIPSGGWLRRGERRREEFFCHVRSGVRAVTHVSSGGWERRISAMYAVGNAQ